MVAEGGQGVYGEDDEGQRGIKLFETSTGSYSVIYLHSYHSGMILHRNTVLRSSEAKLQRIV